MLALLPLSHPIFRPLLGAPSHLLWFAHVFPVALASYVWGMRGAGVSVVASVLAVTAGEATFGAGYWVAADLATVLALGVSVGITEMLLAGFALWVRAAERQRQQLERVAATALDSARDAAFLLNSDLRVWYANEVSRQLFAAEGNELRGTRIDELVDEPEQVDGLFRRGTSDCVSIVGRGRGGRCFPAELCVSPVPDAENENGGRWYVTVRDRSEEIKQEEKERRARALQQLGAVTAAIAHELNNPLTSVAAYSELLEAQAGGLPPEIADSVAALAQEGRQAARIARQLLDRVKHGGSDYVRLDLNEVILRTLRSQTRQLAAHGVTVDSRLEDDPLPVRGNAGELQEILVNLVANAVQAMDEASHGGRLRVQSASTNGHAEIVVADSGPGIPESIVGHIFDPFFTTKGDKGTGIGLALSRRIARAHGGDLVASNLPEGGAQFRLTLPIARSRASGSSEVVKSDPGRSEPPPGTRVLLVDDEERILRSLGRLLQLRGFPTETAGRVAEAREKLAQHEYDVVVCDVHMPEETGFDLYETMREKGYAAAFVLITGDVLGPDVERFLAETGSLHVAKPFEVSEIIAALGEAHARSNSSDSADRAVRRRAS
ncbi:MAG: ATP-binding protein [Gemmatimonadales bacterium]